jgi:hypothetical protein
LFNKTMAKILYRMRGMKWKIIKILL